MPSKSVINAIENSIIDLHNKARKYHKAKIKKSNVRLGRSPSLSPYFEQRFVKELARIYKKYSFYVDYPIRLYDLKARPLSSQNIYPDVMVLDKNKVLKAIIELKTDIGHLDVDELRRSKREKLLQKAKFAKTNSIVGRYSDQEHQVERITIDLSKKYLKIFVVVTLVNQHSDKGYPKSKKCQKAAKKLGYRVLFLLENCHYNNFYDKSDQIRSEIKDKGGKIIRAFRGL